MAAMGAARLSVTLTVPFALLDRLEPALGETAYSLNETPEGWSLTAYATDEDEARDLAGRLQDAAAEAGLTGSRPEIAPVPDLDWVSHVRTQFPPVTAGRFHVRSRDSDARPPPGRIPIVLDAGQAFGSGAHETTRGCLIALDRLARRFRPARVLDVGTGSGILAIAAWHLWHCEVWGTDDDPVAIRVAAENAVLNRARLRLLVADGVRHCAFRRAPPFEIVLANILARPLERLAPSLVRRTAPGGWIVLSGLLVAQETQVTNAFRRQDARLHSRIRLGEWSTLILRRRGPGSDPGTG